MRKTMVAFFLFGLLLLSTACSGGYSVQNPHTVPMMNGMGMRYSKFNGKKSEIIIAPWENAQLNVEVVTESGTLAIAVARDDDRDNPINRWDNIPTSQFTIPLPETGAYYVWVEAKDHKGSFWIDLIPGK